MVFRGYKKNRWDWTGNARGTAKVGKATSLWVEGLLTQYCQCVLIIHKERRCWWLSDANFLGVCVCCRMFIREGNIYMASEALNVWAGIHILHIMVKQKMPDTCGYTCHKQQSVASWTKNTVQKWEKRNNEQIHKSLFWAAVFGSIWFEQKVGRMLLWTRKARWMPNVGNLTFYEEFAGRLVIVWQ